MILIFYCGYTVSAVKWDTNVKKYMWSYTFNASWIFMFMASPYTYCGVSWPQLDVLQALHKALHLFNSPILLSKVWVPQSGNTPLLCFIVYVIINHMLKAPLCCIVWFCNVVWCGTARSYTPGPTLITRYNHSLNVITSGQGRTYPME